MPHHCVLSLCLVSHKTVEVSLHALTHHGVLSFASQAHCDQLTFCALMHHSALLLCFLRHRTVEVSSYVVL